MEEDAAGFIREWGWGEAEEEELSGAEPREELGADLQGCSFGPGGLQGRWATAAPWPRSGNALLTAVIPGVQSALPQRHESK